MSTDNGHGSPELTAAQRRSLAFREWELEGRGWAVWPDPVSLEPRFYWPDLWPAPGVAEDDGKIHRLPVRALLGAYKLAKRLVRPAVPEGRGEITPTPALVEPRTSLELSLPARIGGNSPDLASLLSLLPTLHNPLNYEVLGTHEQVQLLLNVSEKDVRSVRTQVRAQLPAIALREVADPLVPRWLRHEEQGSLIVDFGLASEWMRPLLLSDQGTQVLVTGLLATLSDLDDGELAVLQLQVQACRAPWSEAAMSALVTPSGKPFHGHDPELLAVAKRKLSHEVYGAVLRLGICAPSQGRGLEIAQGVARGLSALSAKSAGRLMPLDPGPYDQPLLRRDLLLRQSRRSGMLLTGDDLAPLMSLPGDACRLEKLRRLASSTRAAPQTVLGAGLLLGSNEHAGESCEVRLPPRLRSRHMHLIGASGTGKSTLMLQMALQDLEEGRGFALIDPHGDLVDDLLARMPEKRYADLVLVDPADPEFTVGFNVLSAKTDLERQLLSSDLVAMFRRLSTSWGDQMTSVLGNAILAFLESSEGGTLADLRRFLVEKSYRREFLETVADEEVRYFWEREFPLLSGRPQAPLLTRLDAFLRHKLVRQMVAQKQSSFDLREIMDSRKVLLVRLSQGAIGEENAALLGGLFVSRMQQAAQSRQELRESDRVEFTLYLDEFHNYLTPSMASILSGARKYRLGLVLAHQELGQLGKREDGVLGAAISNPATRVCFRLGDGDAKKLAGGFEHFEAGDLQGLGLGQALVRVEQAGSDFNLCTDPVAAIDRAQAHEDLERATLVSRQRYARPRAEVAEELARSRGEAAKQQDKAEEIAAPSPTAPAVGEEVDPAAHDLEETMEATPRETPPLDPALDVVQETAAAPTQPQEMPDASSLAGRGGNEHKRWQERFRDLAHACGWKARIEGRLPRVKKFVDVLIERDGVRIGIEVGMGRDVEHELGNIEKCVKEGLSDVFSPCALKETLAGVRQRVAKLESVSTSVHVSSPEEVLVALARRLKVDSSTQVRGHIVRVLRQDRGAPLGGLDRLRDIAKRLWLERSEPPTS